MNLIEYIHPIDMYYMKHLLISILTGEIKQLYTLLEHESVDFHWNGVHYTLTNRQLRDAICCKYCSNNIFIQNPKILIKNYIFSTYVFCKRRKLKRNTLKAHLRQYLSTKHIQLNNNLWRWVTDILLGDAHSQYRKLRLCRKDT